MGDSGYWVTSDRFYSYDAWTFTKRELRPSERSLNSKQQIIKAPWTRERLQNEFEVLELIATKTTIPVPKVLRFEQVWGAYQLVMERVNGKPLDRIKDNRAKALLNAEDFINTTVLPQLRSLTSCTAGALIGVVIPPVRITTRDKRARWPAKVANTPLFSFCHNDLAQHNILINEDTLQVEAIIDWELSGYYPPEFEAPLWTRAWNEPGYHDIEADKIEELICFLSDTGKQKRAR
jgi:aminoglycoside phosphotransferase (APT) family kinase protein